MKLFVLMALLAHPLLSFASGGGLIKPSEDSLWHQEFSLGQPVDGMSQTDPSQIDQQTVMELAASTDEAEIIKSLDSFLSTTEMGRVLLSQQANRALPMLLADGTTAAQLEHYHANFNPAFLHALWVYPMQVATHYQGLHGGTCEGLIKPLAFIRLILPRITLENAAAWGMTPEVFAQWARLYKGIHVASGTFQTLCTESHDLVERIFSGLVDRDNITDNYFWVPCGDDGTASLNLSKTDERYLVNLTVHPNTGKLFGLIYQCAFSSSGYQMPDVMSVGRREPELEKEFSWRFGY